MWKYETYLSLSLGPTHCEVVTWGKHFIANLSIWVTKRAVLNICQMPRLFVPICWLFVEVDTIVGWLNLIRLQSWVIASIWAAATLSTTRTNLDLWFIFCISLLQAWLSCAKITSSLPWTEFPMVSGPLSIFRWRLSVSADIKGHNLTIYHYLRSILIIPAAFEEGLLTFCQIMFMYVQFGQFSTRYDTYRKQSKI